MQSAPSSRLTGSQGLPLTSRGLLPRRRAQRQLRAGTVHVQAKKGEQQGLGGAVKSAGDNLEKALNELDDNILNYCSLDPTGKPRNKQSLGEKEADFLDALRSFYYDNQPIMSNEEFDNLKEELLWAGSKVAVLSSTEQRFMEASKAYAAGKPFLSDSEYDDLRAQLRTKNSKVVQQGPRCSIRTRNLYSDANPAYLKMTLLNLPAAIGTLLALFALDDFTGFEITKLVELPEPWGIVVVWGLVLPLIFLFVNALTGIILKDGLILQGQCPNCSATNTTYFGDIFTVPGPRETTTVTCPNCKTKLTFSNERRQIIVQNNPGSATGTKKEQKSGPAAGKDATSPAGAS
ncbi:hypothetical protein WJX84_002626 [Apatococcus fuscideae]|uniref:Uncharacterized protein n=1 Tax=Apatococcus fuscideae TaxID=2026836 RepID=A0AAW1T5N6_9CHLO